MEKIPAIFIDAENRRVVSVMIEPKLEVYYEMMKCGRIENVAYMSVHLCKEGRNWLAVDEEGLLKESNWAWSFKEIRFVGNALILGWDEEGETVGTSIGVTDIIDDIEFHGLE